jgi:hypothetical protein
MVAIGHRSFLGLGTGTGDQIATILCNWTAVWNIPDTWAIARQGLLDNSYGGIWYPGERPGPPYNSGPSDTTTGTQCAAGGGSRPAVLIPESTRPHDLWIIFYLR